VLAEAERDHGSGNACLAVRLLDDAGASQACRIAAISQPRDLAILRTITAAGIPAHLQPAHDQWPGQYL
jgi:hypothetical protein